MASIHLNERQYNDYVVNARIDRYVRSPFASAMSLSVLRSEGPSGTIVINFFLGGVPRSPCDWERAEKLGVITFMGTHGYASETRVVRYETGQISITSALMDLVEYKTPINGDVLMTLDRGEVARFLKKHLHWRVQSVSTPQREFCMYLILCLFVGIQRGFPNRPPLAESLRCSLHCYYPRKR